MQAIGTRSAILLMREAFYGTQRFDDFVVLSGLTEAVTAQRLRELVEAGLLAKQPYREPGQRTRYGYVLTDSGRDLMPAVFALGQWAAAHVPHRGTPRLSHDGCGQPVDGRLLLHGRTSRACRRDRDHRLRVSFRRIAVLPTHPAQSGRPGPCRQPAKPLDDGHDTTVEHRPGGLPLARILILHPGEMGAAVGAALVDVGHEVVWIPDGRSAETRSRAERSGLRPTGDATDCDLVISVCPPAAASAVAVSVVHLLPRSGRPAGDGPTSGGHATRDPVPRSRQTPSERPQR